MKKPTSFVGNTDIPLQPIYDKLLLFLEHSLPLFPLKFQTITQEERTEKVTSENDITQILDTFLQEEMQKSKESYGFFFIFKNQYKPPHRQGTTDIGVIVQVYSYTEAICFIEAKRLPADDKTEDKRDYAVTKKHNGGIERFKTKAHGSNLPISIMLAYVQKNDFEYWYQQINEWIEAQIVQSDNAKIDWLAQDKLVKKPNLGVVNTYYSKHSRLKIPNDTIVLHHYWLKIT